MDLNTRILEFVKEFLEEDDENLINKLMSFFTEIKYSTGTIPGVPGTADELKASIARAEEEYKNGQGIEHDKVFEKYKQWL